MKERHLKRKGRRNDRKHQRMKKEIYLKIEEKINIKKKTQTLPNPSEAPNQPKSNSKEQTDGPTGHSPKISLLSSVREPPSFCGYLIVLLVEHSLD